MLNGMVGAAHIELKLQDKSLVGMGFKINGSDYYNVSPALEF